jgi:threonine dehydrogenase-like Zn-dependent dehydrogenase
MILTASKLQKSERLSVNQLALVEHAVERAAPATGETVLVIGVGPIGLSVVEFAKQKQARVIVTDPDQRRPRLLSPYLGN